MGKKKPALISDIGNVILFFEPRSICERLSDYCQYAPDDIMDLVFKSLDYSMYESGLILEQHLREGLEGEELQTRSDKRFYQTIHERLRVSPSRLSFDQFKQAWTNPRVNSPNWPVVELYEKLKKHGHKIVLLSDTNHLHAEYFMNNPDWPFMQMFHDHVFSYEHGEVKPHIKLFNTAVERTGNRKCLCRLVDDNPRIASGANAIGLNSHCYNSERHQDFVAYLKHNGFDI